MRLRAVLFVHGLVLTLAAACTTTREVHVPVYGSPAVPDASTTDPGDDDDTEPFPSLDAGKDAARDGDSASGGLTPTRKTTAVVTVGAVKRTLERAQFGMNLDGTFHIEAHEGGDPACPDQSSPTPKRTLIVHGVKNAAPGTKQTKAQGLSVTLLDFANDQLPPGQLASKATAAVVEVVTIQGTTEVEVELDVTLAEGTVKGRVFAEHCPSLNE